MPYRVGILLSIVLVSSSSFAQRYYFDSRADQAKVETKIIENDRGVASVEIELSVPQMDMDKMADGFDDIRVPGLNPLAQAGKPDLATTGVLLAVPEGYAPVLSVSGKQVQELNDVMVKPAQKKFRCGPKEDEAFAFDSSLYASDSVFPSSAIRLEEVGRLRELRLVRLALYPLQWQASSRKLSVTTRANIRIDFQATGDAVKAVRLPSTFMKMATAITANAKSLGRKFLREEESETMLVISGKDYLDAIEPYIAHKRSKGITVEVVTATTAGATNKEIKKYVQNYYNTVSGKLTYLLMVGNNTTAPGNIESTASGPAATDYTYAVLAGEDEIPDITYGRLLGDNVDEIKTQVQRWIEYERSPEVGGSWYTKGTTIASNEGADPSDKEYAEQIQEALKAGTYTDVDGFYQGEQTATAKNITAAVTEGRTWLSYFGHGSGTSWGSTNDTFSVATVAKQDNANRLPIIIDVACQNGSWIKISKCFGKAWVTHKYNGSPAGAVGYYGGSVNISWHPPAIMSVGTAKFHFEKGIKSLGGTVLAGQLYLVEQKGINEDVTDNIKWYNLFGDPAMEIRSTVP